MSNPSFFLVLRTYKRERTRAGKNGRARGRSAKKSRDLACHNGVENKSFPRKGKEMDFTRK